MSFFSAMTETLFQSPLAEDATYLKNGSGLPAFPIRVFPISPDAVTNVEGFEVIQKTYAFDILKSALEQPSKGDVLTFKGQEYKIRTWICRDVDRLIWTVMP